MTESLRLMAELQSSGRFAGVDFTFKVSPERRASWVQTGSMSDHTFKSDLSRYSRVRELLELEIQEVYEDFRVKEGYEPPAGEVEIFVGFDHNGNMRSSAFRYTNEAHKEEAKNLSELLQAKFGRVFYHANPNEF